MPAASSRLAQTIERSTSTRGRTAEPRREFKTRKPTGKPPWPLTLITGGWKCGKSYTALELSSSDVVGATYVVEIGEGAIDLYGEIPGADFQIVDHDGTFDDIVAAVAQAIDQPPAAEGKPNAIVIDGMTEVWDMLSGEQQEIANARLRGSRDITNDQWTEAKKRWRELLDLLRSHHGPAVMTARLEPTGGSDDAQVGGKEWKVRSEKNLPFEADLVIQIPKVREHWISGIRSLKLQMPPSGLLRYEDLTLADVYSDMQLSNDTTAPRRYIRPRPEAAAPQQDNQTR